MSASETTINDGETTIRDERTEEERGEFCHLVIGTDRMLSGWGGAEGGYSYAAWACRSKDLHKVREWVENRSDMQRVREAFDPPSDPYRPGGHCAHLTIYVARDGHPSLG